jgi:hypothetical protein
MSSKPSGGAFRDARAVRTGGMTTDAEGAAGGCKSLCKSISSYASCHAFVLVAIAV